MILGEDITHRDLVPVFDGFLKDLDEVRIGILRHLADFLRVFFKFVLCSKAKHFYKLFISLLRV